MKTYPTDLSDAQWQFIKKTLQLDDRKRKHNLNSIQKLPFCRAQAWAEGHRSLLDYDVLDGILFQYVELKKSSTAIISQGYDEELVKKVLKMSNTAEFKRYQTPPILRISPKAFDRIEECR